MDLEDHLRLQGVEREDILGLIELKTKNPDRSSTTLRGKYISLDPRKDSAKFDAMVESGQVPGCMTDSVFLEGSENGRQFAKNPKIGDHYKKECEKRGGQTKGRKYLSQLAKFPGDPSAWVSGRGDVQKVLEKRGWGSEGSVNVKQRGPDKPPPPPVPIADKIVDRETARELEGQTVTKREYMDKREKVRNRLLPPWARKKK